MRYTLATLMLLLASSAAAQTSSQTSALVDGTANCRAVIVNVRQDISNGGSVTTLRYVVRDTCANQTLFEGLGPIAASAYKVQQSSHALSVQTQHGAIQLVWKATNEHQQTYSSTAVERKNGTMVQRVQEDQFWSTATAEGIVLGTTLVAGDRPGTIQQITQTTR